MSYAEAATSGAVNDEGIPVEHVNVTEEVAKEAEKVVKEAENVINGGNKGKIDKVKDAVKDEFNAVSEELKDPVVSSSVLFTLLAVSGGACYLANQHKADRLTWPTVAVVSIGVVVAGALELFAAKKVLKKE